VELKDALKVVSQGDTDHAGVLDLLRVSTQLVPHRRLLPELLLQFALFHRSPAVLSASATPAGAKSRVEFTSQAVVLSSGVAVTSTVLTSKVRVLRLCWL
jgi:hypothetical protein